MHSRMITLAVVALAVTIGAQVPRTQTQIDVPAAVNQAIVADGTALVIVGVRGAFALEGSLSDADAAAQREVMHAAVEGVMGRAAAAGAVVGTRFETIPFF